MKWQIDLNCDLGESYGAFQVGEDEHVLNFITSANIACGYHAGDHNVIAKTVKLAKEKKVAIGAHPGFQDIAGFGRRIIETTPLEVYNMVLYQIGAISGFAKVEEVAIHHVKPHGALYNLAAKDKEIADAIASAVSDFDQDLILYGLAGSELLRAGERRRLRVVSEVFADRTYLANGALTPRKNKNAIVQDPYEAAKRVIKMIKKGSVESADGTIVRIQAQTVCVHGDTKDALLFVQQLKEQLVQANITVRPIRDMYE